METSQPHTIPSAAPRTEMYKFTWEQMVERLNHGPELAQALELLDENERRCGFNLPRLWELLDLAWRDVELQHPNMSEDELLSAYYRHPVWLLNAAFSESDQATLADRMAAIRLISHVHPRTVLDFGGGIGTTGRLAATSLPSVERADIFDVGAFSVHMRAHLESFTAVRQIREISPAHDAYDAVVCTEVLEHLPDPVGTVAYLNSLLRIGGAFAASWSFGPGIRCHLPRHFHLQPRMLWIVRSLGFGFYGFERRGSTVFGFIKHQECTPTHLRYARILERLSKMRVPYEKLLRIRSAP